MKLVASAILIIIGIVTIGTFFFALPFFLFQIGFWYGIGAIGVGMLSLLILWAGEAS